MSLPEPLVELDLGTSDMGQGSPRGSSIVLLVTVCGFVAVVLALIALPLSRVAPLSLILARTTPGSTLFIILFACPMSGGRLFVVFTGVPSRKDVCC